MNAVIQAVQPYELHGTLYFAFRYLVEGEQQLREARISHDMAYADPQPGDAVDVHSILGIVDRVTKLEAQPPA
ncbi:MAG: hypothetical protein DWI48_04050 [Chloroflexi bacterium]|nr:MAG: hypothetical protein DWI48_04050 [Chloroflexota bacterium]